MNVMTLPPNSNDIDRFWKLESLGISADENDETVVSVMKEYQKTHISFKDGKYEARLPWKQEFDNLPTNFEITKRRTEHTIQRLSKDPSALRCYGEIIADQERRDFIEKVPEGELLRNDRQVHYIPHHPVQKDSDTTPLRIVYDCSCRQHQESPSLNDCLQSNPPALNDLTSILVKFRLKEFAASTDIEKAFLHIGLQECDRDVTRFLWLSDPSDVNSPLQTYKFKTVLYRATCSPFILDATLQKHLKENSDKWASKIMKKDPYVDNIISSSSDEKAVLSYFRDARDLMSTAGFNLRAWASNSAKLRKLAESENVSDSKPTTKVLGMNWNTLADDLGFPATPIRATPQKATKREILRHTSRIYDPLGLLTPVTERAKILIQYMWRTKL
ncbi:uncharacterized protein LOC127869791 [Dreissena polymorpha]|uniref:uncharacterized protein LOC127869791 n=1 Tax=Dreissena polymorpha TaxID=45954 RepID=UPI002263FDE1|nr:uncharacterized protein LOC127869791 [Dreissena polymorpha]